MWKVKHQLIEFEDLNLKEPQRIDNTLPNEHAAQKLWQAAPDHVKHFIVFTLYLGWRKSNVLGIRGEGIDLESGTIRVIAKGDKEIIDPIPDGLAEYIMLHNLHNTPYPCGYKGLPVSDIKTAWNTMFKNTGIKRIRIHDLRHTFGTWLYAKTGDQRLIQDSLHHSDIKTSVRYTHTQVEQRRAKINKALTYRFNKLEAV